MAQAFLLKNAVFAQVGWWACILIRCLYGALALSRCDNSFDAGQSKVKPKSGGHSIFTSTFISISISISMSI